MNEDYFYQQLAKGCQLNPKKVVIWHPLGAIWHPLEGPGHMSTIHIGSYLEDHPTTCKWLL